MDEASREALSRAFEMEARAGGQPWGLDTILEKATLIRGFLEAEGTTEPVWSRIELLEANLDTVAQRVAEQGEAILGLIRAASLQQPSKGQRTSPDRPAKGRSSTSAAEGTTTTPPDPEYRPDINVKAPDPVPVDF